MKKMILFVASLLLGGVSCLSYAQPSQTKTSAAKYMSVWSVLGMAYTDGIPQFTQNSVCVGFIDTRNERWAHGGQLFFPSANNNAIDYDDYNPTVMHLSLKIPLHAYYCVNNEGAGPKIFLPAKV